MMIKTTTIYGYQVLREQPTVRITMGDEEAGPNFPENIAFIVPQPWNTVFFKRFYIYVPPKSIDGSEVKEQRYDGYKTHKAAATAAKLMGLTPAISEKDIIPNGDVKKHVDYYTKKTYS